MKKIFNLAVILSTLFAGVAFTSCDDSEEDAQEEVDAQQLTQINVEAGKKYSFSCAVKSGTIEVLNCGTEEGGSADDKEVTFKLELKGDAQNGESFTLGDVKGASYFGYDGTTFKTYKQADAVANPEQILFALNNDAKAFTIESANVNKAVAATSKAPETKFAIVK